MDSEILWCLLAMVPKLQPLPHLDHPLVAIPKIFAPIHYVCRKKVSISKG